MPELRQLNGVLLISFWSRLLLALSVVLIDILVFILPLTAFFFAYVIIARPRWFKEWVDRLYG